MLGPAEAGCLEGRLVSMRAISRSVCGVCAAGMLALPALGGVTFRVTVNDPEGLLTGTETAIASSVVGAGSLWSRRLMGETELWVEVRPAVEIDTIDCRSFTWSYFETLEGAIDVFEPGASVHVRNGFPASSFDPDIILEINPKHAALDLWFDPDPAARTEPVDPERIDAVSEFARGLGRAFGFDGWMNGTDGTFAGTERSTFDRHVDFSGTEFFFEGVNAMGVYAGPVPMTFGVPFRLGNEPPAQGADLLDDLMSGRELEAGRRYDVSDLDFAILRDARVPIVLPCPCDLTGDGFVDDADFSYFTLAYDLFDCADAAMPAGCPADFNRDALIDDADYIIFVDGYGEFLCPY